MTFAYDACPSKKTTSSRYLYMATIIIKLHPDTCNHHATTHRLLQTFPLTLVSSGVDACPGALSGWASVQAQDGSTAADLANLTGARNINANMEDKLAGYGTEEPAFQFDPETGELLKDYETSLASGTAETTPGANEAAAVQSQPAPLPHLRTALPEKASGVEGSQSITNEEPDSPVLKLWLSTGSQHTEDEGISHVSTSLHQRGKGYASRSSFRDEEDLFLERKGFQMLPPPHTFDSHAAVLSAVVIGLVSCVAMGLRYCLDCRATHYGQT